MNMHRIRAIILEKFRLFCKHSTLHGFFYYHDKRPWIEYAIWTSIIASGIGLCVFLSMMIWHKYIIDPTFTVVQNMRYSVENIPFPSVTLCDSNAVYGPNTENVTLMLIKRGYNKTEISAFYDSLIAVKEKDYVVTSEMRKMHAFLQDQGFPLMRLSALLKKSPEDFLKRCMWRSMQHNCSDMFQEIYTFAGYCYRFDIDYFRQNVDKNLTFTAGVDNFEGLSVFMNSKTVLPNGTVTDGHVLVFVLDSLNKVTFMDNGITLSNFGYFDVSINVWSIDSANDVTFLPVSSRNCLLESDIAPKKLMSHQECMTTIILKRVVNYCRCLPFNYTVKDLRVENYILPCTWERLACIYQTIEMVQNEIRELVSGNECLLKCDYVQYDTETDFVKQHRVLNFFKGPFTMVAVHYSSNTCMRYRREVLYTWDQMLANLGGIFGLCLGGSIISVIELIWFLFDTLIAVITVTRKKKISSQPFTKPVHTDNLFTLTRKDMKGYSKDKKIRFVN